MANSFADLKKSRNNLDQLNSELDKLKSKSYDNNDERFWQPTADKNGTGSAVIRFLDAPAGEDAPFVRLFEHSWEGPGGWYINKCPSTLGEPSPVFDEPTFKAMWKEDKERAKKEVPKRQTRFIFNILVVSDPKNPDCEGKVWLYKCGPVIFDKLNEKWNPEFEDMDSTNPCDLWEGRNFSLRFKKKDGFRNYDASSFSDEETPVAESDSVIEKIWKSEYSLKEFLNPDNFKSYDDLKKELHRAMGKEDEPLFMRENNLVDTSRKSRVVEDETPPFEPSTKKTTSRPKAEDEEDPEEFLKRIKNMVNE